MATFHLLFVYLLLCTVYEKINIPYHTIPRGRPWRYSVIPSTADFTMEYQIRRHSNPAGLPTFAAILGHDFRASIIRLTCPHVFKQIKKYNYFDDDLQSQSSPTKLRRPTVIGMQRRGTRADGHRRLLHSKVDNGRIRLVKFRPTILGSAHFRTVKMLLETFSSRDVDVNVERKRSLPYVA